MKIKEKLVEQFVMKKMGVQEIQRHTYYVTKV